MSFYLLSEGLTCLGMFSGAYESLKVLSRAQKGVDATTLVPILEFWLVLASLTIFEEYIEFFVSWLPFFYFFKCVLLVLVLTPNTKIPHVLYESFIEPSVDYVQLRVHAYVVPLAEALVVKHGHWFHEKLLSRSLSLLSDVELQQYEHELQEKVEHVREEVRARRRRAISPAATCE